MVWSSTSFTTKARSSALSGVCVGLDIVLHPKNNDLVPGFVKILDGVFISHSHGDHFDKRSRLVPALKKAGKLVIMPKNNESVALGNVLKTGKIGTLEWAAFRGGHISPWHYFSNFYHLKMGEWDIVHIRGQHNLDGVC